MITRVQELQCKDVVCLKDGVRIGTVDDIEFDTNTAEVLAIVVYGRKRLFGLLGREDDCIIRWKDIEIIGEDTILVGFDQSGAYANMRQNTKKKGGWFRNLFK